MQLSMQKNAEQELAINNSVIMKWITYLPQMSLDHFYPLWQPGPSGINSIIYSE